ncbi:PAS domain-containing protein [Plasmodiophora brassicae]
MRRNLSRGTNAILDQRRRLVCRRVDDGTVFDATVFLKLFIDQEHLSVLGVVDTRQHRSVDGDATAIVVLDENGIVTATCRQAPTVFDVRPGLRFEDAVPGWNGQSRTGALMTTAGRRRRIDIDAEPFTLGNEDGATAACVARIKVSSSSHMGTESETGLGAGAAPNLTDLQVAMLNDDGEDDEGNDGSAIEVTFTDDEDDDDEESQLLDKATNGGGASSATSATGAGDTTSQDDDATQRQRALLTWLQRATVMLSIVLCVVTLASLPIRSALLSSQVATIAKLSSSASRSTDLITIALCAQDLKDMSVGILDPSGQSGTRADIVAFAADVAAKNGASIQRGDLADTALIDDLTMSMAYANEIAMMPLNALASSAVVAFLMENSAGPVADRVLRVDQSMEDQFAYDLNAYSTFGTVVIVLVAIGVTLLAVLALRGVVVTALRDRDDVFLQLLRIPRQHIRALIPPTLKHLTLLTAAGDMTVQEGADANPVATETPATSQGAADRRNEDAITEGSGARRARYLQVARRLFVIIILNAAALAAATAVLGSLSTRMGAFPAIYDWSWREEAAARRALLSVRQAIASNTTVSYAAAQADIQTASDVMNALIYGSPADGIPSGRLDASAPLFQLMFSSM